MEEKEFILFENYISKNLSDLEINNFEVRLANDTIFLEAFNSYKRTHDFLDDKFKNEEDVKCFEENLESISQNYFSRTETKKVITFRPWKVVATVAASIILFFGFFFYNESSTPTYSDYNSHQTISLTTRGNEPIVYKNAEKAFNSGSYEKANIYFSELLEKDSTNQKFLLYKAITDIEINKFNEANKLLINITNGSSVYKHRALWYAALSKLKQNENSECLEILQKIPKEAEEYVMAQKLIKKLK